MREYAAKLRPYFAWAGFFSLVINVLLLVPALFMLQVYDRVVTSGSQETLVMLGVIAVIALAFMGYLDALRSRLLAAAGASLEKMTGPRVLATMVRRGAAPESRETAHGLRDVTAIRAFLSGPGIMALLDAPWAPIYLALIWLFHRYLGMFGVVGALLLFLFALLNERFSRKPLESMQVESRKASRIADQSIANAEVAGALGMAENLARGWQRVSRKVLTLQLEANRSSSVLTSLTRFSRQTLQVGMLGLGAWLVIEQHTSSGIMIAATILLGRALVPVELAIGGWKAFVDARAAYRRLDQAFASEQEVTPPTELPAPEGTLSVEDAVFGFHGHARPVIKGVSFGLVPGEVLCIVGPSAAGKSTLARLLVGLWKPNAGSVRLDGADISSWPRERLGPFVGYLPQNVELFAGTVAQNIARMGEVDGPMVVAAAKRANADATILRLPHGYDTQVGEGAMLLSAGQRQRVALARALYGNPKLVVLDEPNSNLDREGEHALILAIRKLKQEKVTVVVVTHRPALLAAADKVLLLVDGVIRKFGVPADSMAKQAPRPAGSAASVIAGRIGPRG